MGRLCFFGGGAGQHAMRLGGSGAGQTCPRTRATTLLAGRFCFRSECGGRWDGPESPQTGTPRVNSKAPPALGVIDALVLEADVETERESKRHSPGKVLPAIQTIIKMCPPGSVSNRLTLGIQLLLSVLVQHVSITL